MRAFASLVILTGCVTSDELPPLSDPNGLPACASAKMTEIFGKTRSAVPAGSVTDELFVTAQNYADPQLLLDGPEIFPAMHELIASAKVDVTFQTYVWEPDTDPTNEILAGVAELARRRAAAGATTPVNVRFLFDVGTSSIDSSVDALPATWASVQALQIDPRYVKFELAGVPRNAIGVLHKKTVVVDGREAIITGANPQAHHDYATPWRDSGYRLVGEVALALQNDFDQTWLDGRRWKCGANGTDFDECTVPTIAIERPAATVALASDTCQTMLVTTRRAETNPTSNSTDSPQDQAFLAAFGAATKHIRMQTPNLNDDAAKQALLAAIQRGVRVDVVLAKGFNDGTEVYPGQGGTNVENVGMLYDALRTAGVPSPCEKLRIRWHTQDGVVVFGNGPYASHAKYTSLDDEIVIAGTANMDTQSWNNSREINVIVDDPAITVSWDNGMFLKDFAAGIVVDQCK